MWPSSLNLVCTDEHVSLPWEHLESWLIHLAILGLSTGSGLHRALAKCMKEKWKAIQEGAWTHFLCGWHRHYPDEMYCTTPGAQKLCFGVGWWNLLLPLNSGGHWWKRFFSSGVLSLLKPPVTWKEEGSIQEKRIYWSSVIWLGSISSCFSKWNKKVVFSLSFFFLFFAVPCGGTLGPSPGTEAVLPALEIQSLNHWTAREVPVVFSCKHDIWQKTLSLQSYYPSNDSCYYALYSVVYTKNYHTYSIWRHRKHCINYKYIESI